LVLAAALNLIGPAAAGAQPAPAPPRALAGPSSQVTSLNGLSIARDGTGGLVYLAGPTGAQHVYVSRLVGGVFQAPRQVDAGLSGTSSQPVIAAGNGGMLLVGFINAGNLYVADTSGSTSNWQKPLYLHGNAQSPAISMSDAGKAYLAFTASAGSGTDVDAEYFYDGSWQAATAPFNVTPGDDAGTGPGRPAVVCAGDGVGIVTWGEGGHVYARRVWYTSTSTEAPLRLDPQTFDGANEVPPDTSAGSPAGFPAVSAGGNSSYPDIAYDETLTSGSGTWHRVLVTRLIAEDLGPTAAADDLSSPGSAGQPGVAMGEYGTGFVVAGDNSTDQLVGTPLGSNGEPSGSPEPVSSGPSTAPIQGIPGIAGMSTPFIAWEQASGRGQPTVELSWGSSETALESPIALSAAAAQVQPGDGLAAAADKGGDAAVAWVQGQPGSLSLELDQLYQPPGTPNAPRKMSYSRVAQPVLSWSPSSQRWGPITYQLTVGSRVVGQTSATSLRVPTPLIDGPHAWKVTAANPAGQTATGSKGQVFVDTTPPQLQISLSGRYRRHDRLTLRIHAADRPAAQPGAKASGLAQVRVSWGDGTVQKAAKLTRLDHVYASTGRYRIKVRATDKAGNTTTVTRTVRIRA
jgi:hypothetical protein